MFTKVSVLVPTRGRVGRLRTMLRSYEATTRGAEGLSELVFRADEDDPETQAFLLGRRVLIGPRLLGYGSMPTFFNELAAAAAGDVLMLGNDDVVFRTHGWAVRILEAANRYPDGIFDIGVRTHNQAHFPLSVVSKKVVDRLGFICDPRVFWVDIFLRDVMTHFGRTVSLSSVEIDHDWAGHNPDQVFLEGEGARRSDWMGAHAEAVGDAVTALGGGA